MQNCVWIGKSGKIVDFDHIDCISNLKCHFAISNTEDCVDMRQDDASTTPVEVRGQNRLLPEQDME